MNSRESWRKARVTLAIVAVTALAWFLLSAVGVPVEAAITGGFMPARVGGDDYTHMLLGPLTAALNHWNFAQLAFDMLLLIVCGRIVETILGGGSLLFLYLLGAFAAAAAFWAVDPGTTAVLIGSGGAVAAVVGAYAMLAGRLRTKIRNQTTARAINIVWMGAFWLGVQALLALTLPSQGPNWFFANLAASAAGFSVGLALAKPLLLWKWRGA